MGVIGIDLGTNNVLLCDKKKGIFLRQPSVVVIDRESDGVIAVGRSAQEILERTPSGIYAAKPIHEGKIFDPEIGSTLLRALLKPYHLHRIAKPDFIFTVPSNISQLEERALIEIGQSAGARRVYLVESVLASAIGAKMDFYKPEGRAIVDIGAGVCNIGVLSLGGIVRSTAICIGGEHFDTEIINFLRNQHQILIGARAAEDIKIKIGGVIPRDKVICYEVRGKDLREGFLGSVFLQSDELIPIFETIADKILAAIRKLFENIPAELMNDISKTGIILTGGSALLWGIASYLQDKIGITVSVSDDPVAAAARGLCKIIDRRTELQPGIIQLQRKKAYILG